MGADHLVVGRPIRDAAAPAKAYDAILEEIALTLSEVGNHGGAIAVAEKKGADRVAIEKVSPSLRHTIFRHKIFRRTFGGTVQ